MAGCLLAWAEDRAWLIWRAVIGYFEKAAARVGQSRVSAKSPHPQPRSQCWARGAAIERPPLK